MRSRFAASSCSAWLRLISTWKWSWICCIITWTWSASKRHWFRCCVGSHTHVIWGSAPSTAKHGVHLVDMDVPLFAANSPRGDHSAQSSCWWFTNTQRYCSILAFINPVWLSVCGWNAVDIHWSIPSRLHICPHMVDANWGPWSETIVASKRWSRTTACKNNIDNPTTSILVWHEMKCCIFESLSTTTQIALNPSHSSSLTTKSIKISSHGFSGNRKGRRTTKGECFDVQDRWQIWQFRTQWSTCLRMSYQ